MRRLMPVSARAGIVVTGTEVLTGRVQDRNGPWIADRLLELGVELAHITICGDRPADIEAQLRFMADQGVDLIVTSGGLGPTADDMTVEVVARFCGRELVFDAEVENKIANILKKLMAHFDPDSFESVRAANRKQAMIPAGAQVLDPVGTAPGVVVPGKPAVIVLPGPPRELQPMWRKAIETPAAQEAIAGRTIYQQETIRMFGLPESGLAETLRDAETSISGFNSLEITTCLRRGEIEMVTRYEPDAADVYAQLTQLLRDRHGQQLYSEDGSHVDDLVAQLLAGRRIATAESCTAGLLAARLTDRPGFVRLRDGRRGELLQRGESGATRRRPGTDRGARRGVRTGGPGDGSRRVAALRRRHRRRDHRNRRSGRGNGGKAGRNGLLHRDAWPTRPEGRRSPAPCGFPGTAPTSGSARRRWRCTCCGAR